MLPRSRLVSWISPLKLVADQTMRESRLTMRILTETKSDVHNDVSTSYTRLVQKQMGQLETMLKVVLVPEVCVKNANELWKFKRMRT